MVSIFLMCHKLHTPLERGYKSSKNSKLQQMETNYLYAVIFENSVFYICTVTVTTDQNLFETRNKIQLQ